MKYTIDNGFKTNRRARSLAGFTLVELLVSMAVTSIGMAIMVQAMTVFGNTYRRYKEVVYAQANNRVVTDVVGAQFNKAGYFLARPRDTQINETDMLGSEPIGDIDLDTEAGMHSLTIYGNIFDNYGPVGEINAGTITVPGAPNTGLKADALLRTMSTWTDVYNYNVGSLVQVYTGQRSTELYPSTQVFRLDGVNVDDNSLSVSDIFGPAMGVFADYKGSEQNLFLVSEILPRLVETPVYKATNPNHKLFMTTEPTARRIPAVDFVVDVNYGNLNEVLTYVMSEHPEIASINDMLIFMEVATRTPSEYYTQSSRASGDDGVEGIDLDGDPANGLAVIRRSTLPVVFESLITVDPGFWRMTSQARLSQVRFACNQYSNCGW